MILFYDDTGKKVGHIDSPFPADPEVTERVKGNGPHMVDLPNAPVSDLTYWYFPNGIPTIRPKAEYTVERTGNNIRLSGVLTGVMVTVSGPFNGQVESDGEPVELVFNNAGNYTVEFEAFPARLERFIVEVTAEQGEGDNSNG